MILHIAKREFYDNMNSLRFALTMILILILMIVNAMGHVGEYNTRLEEYGKNVSDSLDQMKSQTSNLYHLVLKGPGKLYKKPSPLTFCAHGGEDFLPIYAVGEKSGWRAKLGGDFSYLVEGIWRLRYPQSNPNLWNIMPDFTKIDWAFIISVVLSFVAILFTFDAISGERERGTLRLILSNHIPRDAVLIGKFLGVFLSISIPFLIGALVNLFWLYASRSVPLGPGELERLSVILLIAFIYISIFITLGLMVSSWAKQSSVSLMILLLIWTVLVVLMPSTLGSIVTHFKPTRTSDEFENQHSQYRRSLYEQYNTHGRFKKVPIREIPATPATVLWAEYLTEEAQLEERFNGERLNAQIAQIKIARSITRLSPAAIVQYAIESLVGTGFPRHLQFLDQVHQYASEFREFLIAADRADPQSPHAYFVKEGMSEKPVRFESIPKFEDRFSFSGALNLAVMDIMMLILFFMVLFASAYLAFLRADIV